MGLCPKFEKHCPKNKVYFKLFNLMYFSVSPHYSALHLNCANKAMFTLKLIFKKIISQH